MQPLRNFLFLDSGIVSEFLAQVEGGTYSEERTTTVSERGRGVGGAAKVGGTGIEGKKGSREQDAVERVIAQTPESEFQRLHAWLEAEEGVKYLEAVANDAEWDGLQRHAIFEAEVQLSVSSVTKIASLAEQVGPVLNLMQQLRPDQDGTEGAGSSVEAIEGFRKLGGLMSGLPIVAALAQTPRYKFVANLSRESVRANVDQLDGDASILFKLQRRIPKGQSHTFFDSLMNLNALPRKARREFERKMTPAPEGLPDLVIKYPVAVITPIAIYR